ncbi:hypothetical protein L7F22_050406 [Adiantum nelumboides]|nr:hypothetical protein [Adiantum nelumboides]
MGEPSSSWQNFNFRDDEGSAQGMQALRLLLEKLQEAQANPRLKPSVNNLLMTEDLMLTSTQRLPSSVAPMHLEGGEGVPVMHGPMQANVVPHPLQGPLQTDGAKKKQYHGQERHVGKIREEGDFHDDDDEPPSQSRHKKRTNERRTKRSRRNSSGGSSSSSQSGRSSHGRFPKKGEPVVDKECALGAPTLFTHALDKVFDINTMLIKHKDFEGVKTVEGGDQDILKEIALFASNRGVGAETVEGVVEWGEDVQQSLNYTGMHQVIDEEDFDDTLEDLDGAVDCLSDMREEEEVEESDIFSRLVAVAVIQHAIVRRRRLVFDPFGSTRAGSRVFFEWLKEGVEECGLTRVEYCGGLQALVETTQRAEKRFGISHGRTTKRSSKDKRKNRSKRKKRSDDMDSNTDTDLEIDTDFDLELI